MPDGIRLNELPNFAESALTNDYTVLVHDGKTYRAAVAKIQAAINPSAAQTDSRIDALNGQVAAISAKADNTASEIAALSGKYLSKSYESAISQLSSIVTDNTVGNNAVYNGLVNLQNAVNNLPPGGGGSGDIGGLCAVVNELSEKTDFLESSFNSISSRIYDASLEAKIAERKADSLLKDSVMDRSFTILDNVPADGKFNPIYCSVFADGYDYYFDEHRFANVPFPVNYAISGLLNGSTVYFTSIDFVQSGSAITSGDSQITDCKTISASGISSADGVAVMAEFSIGSENELILQDFTPIDYSRSISTFNIADGIPLRWGMMVLNADLSTGRIKDATLELSVVGNTDLALFLNSSSFLSNGTKSVLQAAVTPMFGGEAVRKKTSEANAVKDDSDFSLLFNGAVESGTTIKLYVDHVLSSGSAVTLSEIDDLSSKVNKQSLFGMLCPTLLPSEAEPITVEDCRADYDSMDEDNVMHYALRGNVYGGFTRSSVSLSVFYTSAAVSCIESVENAEDNADSVLSNEADLQLNDSVVNAFSLSAAVDSSDSWRYKFFCNSAESDVYSFRS